MNLCRDPLDLVAPQVKACFSETNLESGRFFRCLCPVPCGVPDVILDLVEVSRADITGSKISHSGFLLTQFHCNVVSQQQDAAQERRFALAEVC